MKIQRAKAQTKPNEALKIASYEDGTYSEADRKEDQMTLRAIQRGELGKIPQSQIDAIINRINGVRLKGV